MPAEHVQPGALPTESVSQEQRAKLAKAMTVTPQAIAHLRKMGLLESRGGDGQLRPQAGCCKPDGGTCCPNAK